jgi:dihydrodipicolinate synthase/N-acetylneuraminate lyase
MIPYINSHEYDRFYAALVLPYQADSLAVDLDDYRKLVRYFTQDEKFIATRGALIANPEAGEIFYMTPEERAATIKIALEERPAGMPVFAGAYGVRMEDVIASAVQAKTLGADGIFVLPPTGTAEVSISINGSRNPEIWTDYVRAIAEATELPLIIHPAHPYTQQWGGALPIETVQSVVESIPSVVGWKMIYGVEHAHFHVARYLRSLPRHVAVLNETHFGLHTCLMCDLVDGAVQGYYNYGKEPAIEHALAWQRGDLAAAKRIYTEQIVPVREYLYSDSSRLHIRYKIAAWLRGRCSHPFMRPPMPPPRREEAETMYGLLQQSRLSIISREAFEADLARQEAILKKVRHAVLV